MKYELIKLIFVILKGLECIYHFHGLSSLIDFLQYQKKIYE